MEDWTRLLMLDSGAFTVWTKGAAINLDAYIDFCEQWPDVSYYVNLDVIPGKPGVRPTPSTVEDTCKQGWNNYRRMIERLPKHKVIPVFHQGDPIRWLHKYLDAGVPYLGISPGNDRRTKSKSAKARFAGRASKTDTKLQWLRSIKPILFNGETPRIKLHGFAVTSFDLMNFWRWHSVDSASWKFAGAWGAIYVPHKVRGQWDFTQQPIIAPVSPMSNRRIAEAGNCPKLHIEEWLEEVGVPFGEFELKDVDKGYRPDTKLGEVWYRTDRRTKHKKHHKKRGPLNRGGHSHCILVPITKGVTTGVAERLVVNAEFIKRVNAALKDKVKHIYFAGNILIGEHEYQLGRRLLSYAVLGNNFGESRGNKFLERHCELIRQHKKRKSQ